MLLSGFLSLGRDPAELPLADWEMIINLAWFSNLTHQCGLIFLREYLHQNPTERKWRLVFMTILLATLVAAMAPTTTAVQFDKYYGPQPSTPAKCFYSKSIRDALYQEGNINKGAITQTGAFQITTISIIILVLSFVTRLLKLFETTSRFVRDQIRARISRFLRKVFKVYIIARLDPRNRRSGFRFRIVLLENPLLACYMFLRIFADIYASVFSDVSWVLLSAIFGTKQLAAQRSSLEEPDNISDFGQILPIVMLVAAVLTIRQSFMSGRKPPLPALSTNGSTSLNGGSQSRMLSISSGSTAVASTTPPSEGKDSRVSSISSISDPAPNPTVELEHLLSQEKYVGANWLLPTLFNIAVAIFLFFQLIASSGGGNAQALFVSIILSFIIVAFACCAVILVGFAVDECRFATWVIWGFALQPFGAIVWLSRQVMIHAVSFGELDQAVSMVIDLGIEEAMLVKHEK
ncbi:hypothetical protein HD806DRAFT_541764 [Xylariaceae sp. AK1471]|nr:hypothetical protein HD806DRAFT_541764 [Xylariaceae sp. AK1471]